VDACLEGLRRACRRLHFRGAGVPRLCQDSEVGASTQALYDEAKKDGWNVISMKNDWKHVFVFDEFDGMVLFGSKRKQRR
jgi:hypothetical protein